jgi:hypothetical protein
MDSIAIKWEGSVYMCSPYTEDDGSFWGEIKTGKSYIYGTGNTMDTMMVNITKALTATLKIETEEKRK